MSVHFARSHTVAKPCAPGRVKGGGKSHASAGWFVVEIAGVGGSCAVCSSTNYEGKRACMVGRRAA